MTNPHVDTEQKCSKTANLRKRYAMVDRAHSILLWRKENSLLSVDELAKAASLGTERVEVIIGFGLIEPAARTMAGPLFTRSALERLQRIARLRRDLGINLSGIAAVLDMRERIETLQQEVQHLRGRLRLLE
jgi:MerR HTH family regulatory protein